MLRDFGARERQIDGNRRARCNAQFQRHFNQESCEPLRAVERRQDRRMEAGASGLTIALAIVGGEQFGSVASRRSIDFDL